MVVAGRVQGRLEQAAIVGQAVATGGPATWSAVVQAWRPHLSASALFGAVLLADRRGARALAAVLAATGLAGAAPVVRRAERTHAPPQPGPDDLTVLTANVRHGRADTGALAALVARESPDFVVLPEAGADFRDKLMPQLAGLGYRSWVAANGGARDGADVTLLVGERAGEVRVRSARGMRLPHLEASGGVLGERTLYAVHPTAPMSRSNTAWWHEEMALIARWCHDPVAPLVAGDLNATLDHPPLRAALGGCRSAVEGTGSGLIGTFPARLPRGLGVQIDHVLVPAEAPTTRFDVLDVDGSDHRAVLARVRLPAA